MADDTRDTGSVRLPTKFKSAAVMRWIIGGISLAISAAIAWTLMDVRVEANTRSLQGTKTEIKDLDKCMDGHDTRITIIENDHHHVVKMLDKIDKNVMSIQRDIDKHDHQ